MFKRIETRFKQLRLISLSLSLSLSLSGSGELIPSDAKKQGVLIYRLFSMKKFYWSIILLMINFKTCAVNLWLFQMTG